MLTATLGSQPSEAGRPDPGSGRNLITRLGAGLRAGLALTLGFTATFTVIGLGLTAGLRSLITVVPWLAAALGAVLIPLGLGLLTGRHLPIPLRVPTRHPNPTTGTGRVVAFGVGYAIASATCTLAVLLAPATRCC
jgi:cytochrome c-type biogenesis protein